MNIGLTFRNVLFNRQLKRYDYVICIFIGEQTCAEIVLHWIQMYTVHMRDIRELVGLREGLGQTECPRSVTARKGTYMGYSCRWLGAQSPATVIRWKMHKASCPAAALVLSIACLQTTRLFLLYYFCLGVVCDSRNKLPMTPLKTVASEANATNAAASA